MYDISHDPGRSLITARLSGFLSPAEVDGFFTEEQQFAQDKGYQSGDFSLLIETGGSVIQSQDVVARFVEQIASVRLRARRVAVVRLGAMSKLQTERILALRENAAVFRDRDEALAWLFADDRGR